MANLFNVWDAVAIQQSLAADMGQLLEHSDRKSSKTNSCRFSVQSLLQSRHLLLTCLSCGVLSIPRHVQGIRGHTKLYMNGWTVQAVWQISRLEVTVLVLNLGKGYSNAW